ncbi:putative threonine--tRNA ligase [Lupinus albus]|uniref:Putative threonine--tRNA ligase n=1 Tax=Lupinus albus TaxID=3870 RepID=A0A6A4QHL6_LUPAL|nr:putative threonine--tRNA ligase [Lupinus albus]
MQDCKLCIGPCTTRGEGFYYDAFYGDLGLNDEHFKQIEKKPLEAVGEKQPFERIEVTCDHALEIFSGNKFTIEIINDLPADKTITVYRCVPWLICAASSAYWKVDKNRESLQRMAYLIPTRREYLLQLEEAKKYDHRILGVKQELIYHHEWSWFFLTHGARIYNKLMDFIRNQYRDRGYQEVNFYSWGFL